LPVEIIFISVHSAAGGRNQNGVRGSETADNVEKEGVVFWAA
jgi:hypothetical protein